MPPWLAYLRNLPLWARSGLLVGIVVVYSALVCPVAWLIRGSFGVISASVAGVLCLIGALGALFISHICNMLPPQTGLLVGIPLSTAVRIGVPMGLGTAIHLSGGALAEAGFLYYLLVFYPITLAIETVLSLPEPPPPRRVPPRNTDG